MRKIVAGLFSSLDGVIENPNDWMGPYFSPELGQAVGSLMGAQDVMLLGRVTYGEFAAHWPQQEGEMADTMNGLLDELHLFVFPVVGSGKRPFGSPGDRLPLKLLGSAAFPAGTVHLTCARA